ncbi:general secretion pathway protein GspB [Zobellella sp. DQSA1]|uniref:general secretion pathway protein GspB n=1 Tax=Zobellella sp. DQSA1 TaxID=3342386 RepID=UPI0035BFED98
MSYILDALKQSERQRSRHLPTAGMTLQPVPPAGPTSAPPFYRRRLWWLLAGLVVALLAGYGLGKLGSRWLQSPPGPVFSSPGPQQESGAAPAPRPSESPRPHREPIIIDSAPVRILVDDPPALSLTMPEPVPAPASAPPLPVVSSPTVTREPPAPEFNPGVPDLRELPASVRTRLPALILSVHIYSAAPAGRMANINGHMLREGQQLGPLQVRSITPKGVILSFEGQEFHLYSVGG